MEQQTAGAVREGALLGWVFAEMMSVGKQKVDKKMEKHSYL